MTDVKTLVPVVHRCVDRPGYRQGVDDPFVAGKAAACAWHDHRRTGPVDRGKTTLSPSIERFLMTGDATGV